MKHLTLICSFVLLVVTIPADGVGQSRAGSPGSPACPAIRSDVRGDCSSEAYLLRKLETEGLAVAIATLDSLSRADPEVRRMGHAYAHALGIAAYPGSAEVGRVFGECSPIFQAGCYHGVIQAYFDERSREHGEHLDAGAVDGLCAFQRADPAERWELFQCVHGLGHGLMMTVGHRLPDALDGCDLLRSAWEREVCYSAVFMENIVHATSAETALGRLGAHAHGDPEPVHQHPATSPSAFPSLKRDEPLYPCTVLDDRYLSACYQMQTSAILQQNGFDVGAAAAICPTAPIDFRPTCFQSLGRDISALTVQDHPRAIALCALAPDQFEPFCYLGYAKNLVDLTAQLDGGFAFCRLLDGPESKRVCHVGMGEELWVLRPDAADRASGCLAAEPGYVEACRSGAGLE